jgi:hypothetical protein
MLIIGKFLYPFELIFDTKFFFKIKMLIIEKCFKLPPMGDLGGPTTP